MNIEHIKVVSLFAGCGGSSLGYRMAGFKELLAVEWNRTAAQTMRLNFPETEVLEADIAGLSHETILRKCGLREKELDILDGSPPCQGFSLAGERRVSDPRNSLVGHFIRMVEGIRPKVFVMENVFGMASGSMRGIFNSTLAGMRAAGYVVRCRAMNSANYGVPQSRRRLVFLGVREDLGIAPAYPEPHVKRVSAGEALEGVDNSNEEVVFPKKSGAVFGKAPMAYAARNTRPGRNASTVFGAGIGFGLARIAADRPSPTITKFFSRGMTAGLLHHTEPRYLTIKELKRLASFPDDFMLCGSFEEKWGQIGNCVPPLMVKAVAEALRDKVLGMLPDPMHGPAEPAQASAVSGIAADIGEDLRAPEP